MPEKKHYTFDELHAMAVAAREPKRVGAASSRPSSRTGGETPPPQGDGSPSQFDQVVRGQAAYAPDGEWVPLTFDRSTDATVHGQDARSVPRRGFRNDAPFRNLYIDDTGLGLTPVPPSARGSANHSSFAHGEGPFDRYFPAPVSASPSRRWSTIEEDASMKGGGPIHDEEDSAHGDPIQADRPSDEWDGADGSVATDDHPPPKYVGEEGDDPTDDLPPPKYVGEGDDDPPDEPPPEDPPGEPPIEQPKCTCNARCTPDNCTIKTRGVDWMYTKTDINDISFPSPWYMIRPELTVDLFSVILTSGTVSITSDEGHVDLMYRKDIEGEDGEFWWPRSLPYSGRWVCPKTEKYRLKLTDKGWLELVARVKNPKGKAASEKIDTIKVFLDGELCHTQPVFAEMECDDGTLSSLRAESARRQAEALGALIKSVSSTDALGKVGGKAGDVKSMNKGSDGRPLAAIMELFLTGTVDLSTLEALPDCCCVYASGGSGQIEWVIHHAEGTADSVVKPLLDSLAVINAAILLPRAENLKMRVADAFNKTVEDLPLCGIKGGEFACTGGQRDIEDYNKPTPPLLPSPYGIQLYSFTLTASDVAYWQEQARLMRGGSENEDDASPYWCLGWPDDPIALQLPDYRSFDMQIGEWSTPEGAKARQRVYAGFYAVGPNNPWLDCVRFVSDQVDDVTRSTLIFRDDILRIQIDNGFAVWAALNGVLLAISGRTANDWATLLDEAADWGLRFGATLFGDAKYGIPLLLGWAVPADKLTANWISAASICSGRDASVRYRHVPGVGIVAHLRDPCMANYTADTEACCRAMVLAEQAPGGQNFLRTHGGPPDFDGFEAVPNEIAAFLNARNIPWLNTDMILELLEPFGRSFYSMATDPNAVSSASSVLDFAFRFCCGRRVPRPVGGDQYDAARALPPSNRFGRIPITR